MRKLERGMSRLRGSLRRVPGAPTSCSDDSPDIDVEHRYTGAVFRFVVQQSLDLPEGSEVLVFTGGHRPWFAVGEEHLVVASDRSGMLWADGVLNSDGTRRTSSGPCSAFRNRHSQGLETVELLDWRILHPPGQPGRGDGTSRRGRLGPTRSRVVRFQVTWSNMQQSFA